MCFNPCFNGSDSKRISGAFAASASTGFNPCFNGSDSKSMPNLVSYPGSYCVSILVLMEVTLKVTVLN